MRYVTRIWKSLALALLMALATVPAGAQPFGPPGAYSFPMPVVFGTPINNAPNITALAGGLLTVSTATQEAVSSRFQLNLAATATAPSGNKPLSAVDADLFVGATGTTNTQSWSAPQLVALNANVTTFTGSSGTLAQVWPFQVSSALNATGITITDFRDAYLQNPVNSGTITNLYGLRIQNLTAGGTNYPLYIEGHGPGASIINGHIGSGGTAPTVAAGIQAGTGAPAPVIVVGSSDSRGQITFGTGTAPSAGQMVSVTYAQSYQSTPFVQLTPASAVTGPLFIYTAGSTTGFSIYVQTAPAASQPNTTYAVNYWVIQ